MGEGNFAIRSRKRSPPLRFVGEVTPHEQIGERLAEYCAFLCERRSITMRLTKRTVAKATLDIDLEAQMRLEIACIGKAFGSADGREARQAFTEKRTPVFRGE